jgi:ABC-2 type transport system permease protein
MLWRKAWLDSRWMFLACLVLLAGLAVATVLLYPMALKTYSAMALGMAGHDGDQMRKALAQIRSYPNFVWMQWLNNYLVLVWTLYAAFLGSAGLLQESGSSALFSLSLPVTRRRWLATRSGVAALELLTLAVLPSVVVCMVSPAVGKHYPIGLAMVYALVLTVAGSVMYGMTSFLASMVRNRWLTITIGMGIAILLDVFRSKAGILDRLSVRKIACSEAFHSGGSLPWVGLCACLLVSAALLYSSVRVIERRDF